MQQLTHLLCRIKFKYRLDSGTKRAVQLRARNLHAVSAQRAQEEFNQEINLIFTRKIQPDHDEHQAPLSCSAQLKHDFVGETPCQNITALALRTRPCS